MPDPPEPTEEEQELAPERLAEEHEQQAQGHSDDEQPGEDAE
jgi:hypothetical protein